MDRRQDRMRDWMRETRASLEREGRPTMSDDQLEMQWSNLTCGRSDAYQEGLVRVGDHSPT